VPPGGPALRYDAGATMNDVARELIGRTLGGRFRLTGFLGEGAMASVYRGEQDAEPRDVAVKIMHPELLREASFTKRFTREAKAAARIEHRNTVRILEHGADGELLYLAMELCAGQDLFDLLARERRLSEARAVQIAVQICSALTAAHAHGIVHRDLKPENVMILADPDEPGSDLVKVLDFGIAKIMERERPERDEAPASLPMVDSAPPSSALTMVGTLVGTPEYMSPEQSLGQPVDARSDVYACGVLLFVMITGKQLFTGRGPIDVMMQHADKPPPVPSTLVPGIHPGLEKTILKALSKPAEARHQSAAELRAELCALLPDLATSMRRAPPPSASDPGAAPPGRQSVPKIEISVNLSPETLRSPAQPEMPEAVAVVINEPPAPAPEKKPDAEAKKPSAAEKPTEAKPVPAEKKPDAVAEKKPATAEEKKAAAAVTKPLRVAPRTSDAQPWFGSFWMIALAIAILAAIVWLMRLLRLG
jgi:eukaryotic-like serine/threonine-protein kinase